MSAWKRKASPEYGIWEPNLISSQEWSSGNKNLQESAQIIKVIESFRSGAVLAVKVASICLFVEGNGATWKLYFILHLSSGESNSSSSSLQFLLVETILAIVKDEKRVLNYSSDWPKTISCIVAGSKIRWLLVILPAKSTIHRAANTKLLPCASSG